MIIRINYILYFLFFKIIFYQFLINCGNPNVYPDWAKFFFQKILNNPDSQNTVFLFKVNQINEKYTFFYHNTFSQCQFKSGLKLSVLDFLYDNNQFVVFNKKLKKLKTVEL